MVVNSKLRSPGLVVRFPFYRVPGHISGKNTEPKWQLVYKNVSKCINKVSIKIIEYLCIFYLIFWLKDQYVVFLCCVTIALNMYCLTGSCVSLACLHECKRAKRFESQFGRKHSTVLQVRKTKWRGALFGKLVIDIDSDWVMQTNTVSNIRQRGSLHQPVHTHTNTSVFYHASQQTPALALA